MLAALTFAGLPTRNAEAIKNVLAAVMNASAVALFVTSEQVLWPVAYTEPGPCTASTKGGCVLALSASASR